VIFLVDVGSYLIEFVSDVVETPTKTLVDDIEVDGKKVRRFVNEYWTSRQRKASSIHEVSYRACFKPQLPGFFLELLTKPGDVVYDPFSGRGTTVIEAALRGRNIISNDINPLSTVFTKARLGIPELEDVKIRLDGIDLGKGKKAKLDLSMFYHPRTESELVSMRNYLMERRRTGKEDGLDSWIRMVATSRLTGHSSGFFSVYSLPPNQAVSQKSQIRINKRLKQKPDHRDVKKRILKKSKSLLRNLSGEDRKKLHRSAGSALFLEEDSRKTKKIVSETVSLTITSPPFLDIVQYSTDNWLRCWFNGLDIKKIEKRLTILRNLDQWSAFIGDTFKELYRITKKKGWVAFEVGEIRKGKVELDRQIVPLGLKAGFECKGIMINSQNFTKTSNIWGVDNMAGGTNTNRIVIFKKE
jgi:hypothetical protein